MPVGYGVGVMPVSISRSGVKEKLLKQITYTKLVCSQADRLGIALTEDERMNVDEYTDNYLANFSRTELEYYGITRDNTPGEQTSFVYVICFKSFSFNICA